MQMSGFIQKKKKKNEKNVGGCAIRIDADK